MLHVWRVSWKYTSEMKGREESWDDDDDDDDGGGGDDGGDDNDNFVFKNTPCPDSFIRLMTQLMASLAFRTSL